MPYKFKFRKAAKEEFERLCAVYPGVRGSIERHLNDLAVEAETKQHELSFNWEALLPKDIDEYESLINGSNIKLSWKKFNESGWLDKIKACLVVTMQHRPPWELRCAYLSVSFSEVVPLDFNIVFELNHVAKELIVTKFIGP
jgi:hypothetical protein